MVNKFNNGDYVRNKHNSMIDIVGNFPERFEEEFELWKPEIGELCHFWHPAFPDFTIVAKYGVLTESTKYFTSVVKAVDFFKSFCSCSPYFGELPKHLSNKN